MDKIIGYIIVGLIALLGISLLIYSFKKNGCGPCEGCNKSCKKDDTNKKDIS